MTVFTLKLLLEEYFSYISPKREGHWEKLFYSFDKPQAVSRRCSQFVIFKPLS